MRRAVFAWMLAAVTVAVSAQDRQARPESPTFAAASIKRNPSGGDGSWIGRQPGGRLGADNATLRELILYAYPLQPIQLVDGPDWVDRYRWNIQATLGAAPPPADAGDPILIALRALMAERFKLSLRQEARQLPIYALVS